MSFQQRLRILGGIAILIAFLALPAAGRPAGIVQAGENVGTTTSGPTDYVPSTLVVQERSNWVVDDDESVNVIAWSDYQANQDSPRPEWRMYYLVGCNFYPADDLIRISYRVGTRLPPYLSASGWTVYKTVKTQDVLSQEPGFGNCWEVYFSPTWLTSPPLTQGEVQFKAEQGEIFDGRFQTSTPIDGGAGPAVVTLHVTGNPPPTTPVPLGTPAPTFQTQAMLAVQSGGTIYAGSSIKVSGSGFPLPAPGKNAVVLTLNPPGTYVGQTPSSNGRDLPPVATAPYQLDASGNFSGSVGLPNNAPPGSYTLTAEVGSSGQSGSQLSVVAQANFSISPPPPAGQAPPPTLSLSGFFSVPPQLPQGTKFQISGSGWKAGQVQIYLDGPSGTLIGTLTAGSNGHFSPDDPATLTIESANSGNHTLVGQEAAGGQTLTSQPLPVYVLPALN